MKAQECKAAHDLVDKLIGSVSWAREKEWECRNLNELASFRTQYKTMRKKLLKLAYYHGADYLNTVMLQSGAIAEGVAAMAKQTEEERSA